MEISNLEANCLSASTVYAGSWGARGLEHRTSISPPLVYRAQWAIWRPHSVPPWLSPPHCRFKTDVVSSRPSPLTALFSPLHSTSLSLQLSAAKYILVIIMSQCSALWQELQRQLTINYSLLSLRFNASGYICGRTQFDVSLREQTDTTYVIWTRLDTTPTTKWNASKGTEYARVVTHGNSHSVTNLPVLTGRACAFISCLSPTTPPPHNTNAWLRTLYEWVNRNTIPS